MTKAGSIAADELKRIVERIENIEEQVTELNADKSDIYKEAEARGFDKAALKLVVKRRRMDTTMRAEQDSLVDLYEHALGMHPDEGDGGDGTDDAVARAPHVHEGDADTGDEGREAA